MFDRFVAITFFSLAVLLGGVGVVMLLLGFVDWLQTGRWHSVSLLRAGYDAHLIRARWFLTTDWGWRVHEVLDHIPLILAVVVPVPLFWKAGSWIARR